MITIKIDHVTVCLTDPAIEAKIDAVIETLARLESKIDAVIDAVVPGPAVKLVVTAGPVTEQPM